MADAAPTIWYVNGLRACMRAGFGIAGVTGTLKFVLLHDTYVPDQDAHDFLDDVIAYEASGTGYTAGGLTVSTPTVTVDGVTNESVLDFVDFTGLSVPCCYGVLCVSTGTNSTSPLLTLTDFSAGDAVDQTVTSLVVASNGHAALTAV
jgi:hypothetical protein